MASWLYAALAALVLLVAVGLLLERELRAFLVDQRAGRLRAQAKPVIDRRLEHLWGQISLGDLAAILAMDLTNRETSAVVVDASGHALASGPPDEGPEAVLLPADRYARTFAGDPHVTHLLRDAHGRHLLLVLIPPLAWLPEPPAVVELATYLTDEERLVRRFVTVLGVGAVAVLGLAVLAEFRLGDPWGLLALAGLPVVAIAARRTRTSRGPTAAQELHQATATDSRSDFTRVMRTVEAAFMATRASEQRMRRFIADASHELRTPLTALGGAADVLLEGAAANEQDARRLASIMRKQTNRLNGLVEDLLTLARLDSGLPLRRTRLRLDRLVREHADEVSISAPARTVTVRADEPVEVAADAERLRQVLANLTGNAVTHTATGGTIALTVRADGDTAVLSVADDGEGIAEADLPHVFERFYRGDQARTNAGSGLGLAIACQLVEAHDGLIEVDSRPGAGARFEVRLPRCRD